MQINQEFQMQNSCFSGLFFMNIKHGMGKHEMRRCWTQALIGLFLLIMAFPSWAQIANLNLDEQDQVISSMEARFQTMMQDGLKAPEAFSRLQTEARRVREELQNAKDNLAVQIDAQAQDLQSLGDRSDDDSEGLIKARNALQTELAASQRADRQLSALILKNDQLANRAGEEAQSRLSQRLLTRTESASKALFESLAAPKGIVETAIKLFNEGIGWTDLGIFHVFSGLALIVLGAGAAMFWVRRGSPIWEELTVDDQGPNAYLAFRSSLVCSTRRRVPLLAGLLLAAMYLMLGPGAQPDSLPIQVLWAMTLYVALAGVINVLLSPCAPVPCYLPIEPSLSRRLARRLRFVLVVSLLAWVVLDSAVYAQLPSFHQYLIRAAFGLLWLVNGLGLVWLLGRVHNRKRLFVLRVLFSLAMIITLMVEILGYRNLAEFLATGLLLSYLSLGGGLLLNWLLSSWFDSVDDGSWQPALAVKKRMKLATNDPLPGMIWLRLLATVCLWGIALYVLALGWGLAEAGLVEVGSFLSDGFSVGTIDIVPSNLLIAVLIFVLGWQVAVWAKQTLMPRWLQRTRLDAGTRNTVVTLTGYVGIFFAALIGLSVAGLDFSKLALIAGALSVGIGFGLQNIVNNFVSGLILLFERPIRVGDWIVIGTTEGYVRQISIRSTRIETFDKADIIVPNSDLISNNVTNWMLRDPFGRVIVPIGVAYGSDTDLVKKLLLDVAAAHPLVMMNDPRVSDPKVLFRNFGPNSLDFELRCFISDVQSRLATLSELNFAIDQAFRKHNVQIPFPQQDVYVKSLPQAAGNQQDSDA